MPIAPRHRTILRPMGAGHRSCRPDVLAHWTMASPDFGVRRVTLRMLRSAYLGRATWALDGPSRFGRVPGPIGRWTGRDSPQVWRTILRLPWTEKNRLGPLESVDGCCLWVQRGCLCVQNC